MSLDQHARTTLSYLERIRQHLWLGHLHGKAAVMVGAGFSKNAVPLRAGSPTLPDWRSLAAEIQRGLDPSASDKCDKTSMAPLDIASQYEARFGRTALHKLLSREIPDTAFEPGELHRKLLALPWADVFTTNYDTLLERACTSLPPERRYSVIYTTGGIAASSSPRIVKVHGSFPEYYPLILTQEDYRTYPSEFAPFVNMVQQSLMENAFCLIGFSAEDPNFLAWMGWVRDNLGKNAPKAYLCGLFHDVSAARLRCLEERGIAIVDLSAWLGPIDHAKALDRFFTYLDEGRPGAPQDWLRSTRPARPVASPIDLASISSEVEDLRKRYPGWLVCPHSMRRQLRDNGLERVIGLCGRDGLFDTASLSDQLRFLHAAVWLLDRCLYPVFGPLTRRIETALSIWTSSHPKSRDDVEQAATLILAMMHKARLDHSAADFHRFDEMMEELLKRFPGNPELLVGQHYEHALWAYQQLDFTRLKRLIASWPPCPSTVFWQTRRAALMLVCGERDSCLALLYEARAAIQQRQRDDPYDVRLLSEEAWTLSLLRIAESGESNKSDYGRFNELRRYECDPYAELEWARDYRPTPQRPAIEHRDGFDAGQRNTTIHSGASSALPEWLEAYAIVRLREVSAHLSATARFVGDRATMAAILPTLMNLSLPSALSFCVQLHEKEVVERLNRLTVLKLDPDQVASWVEMVLAHLSTWLDWKSLPKQSLLWPLPWSELASTALEVLSRLTLRVPESVAMQLFDAACVLYSDPRIRNDHALYSELDDLLRRSIEVLWRDHPSEVLSRLIDLPLGNEGSPIHVPDLWPEPFRWLRPDRAAGSVSLDPSRRVRLESITGFVASGSRGRHGDRSRAIVRLQVLHELGLLDGELQERFARSLWSQIDEQSGLPDMAGYYYPSVLLLLPEPSLGQNLAALRRFLTEFDLVGKAGVYTSSRTRHFPLHVDVKIAPFLHTLYAVTREPKRDTDSGPVRLDWTQSEANKFLADALTVWTNRRQEVADIPLGSDSMFAQRSSLLGTYVLLARVIARALMPHVLPLDSAQRNEIVDLFRDMLAHGLPVERYLPDLLVLDGIDRAWVSRALIEAMRSNEYTTAGHAFAGVAEWARAASLNGGKLPGVDGEVRELLVALALIPSVAARDTLFEVLALIVRQSPALLSTQDVHLLLLALDMLRAESLDVAGPTSGGDQQNLVVSAHRLAAALHDWHTSEGRPVPAELDSWHRSARQLGLPRLPELFDVEDHTRPETEEGGQPPKEA